LRVGSGSIATEMDRAAHVRFSPDSDGTSEIAGGPFRARFGHLSTTRNLINSKSRCGRPPRPQYQSELALAGNPDHANGLGTERREGAAQWPAGNLHQTRKWLTQLQD
jgi:hypothetical protein